MMTTGSLSFSTVRSVLMVVSFLYSLLRAPSESCLVSVFTSVVSVVLFASVIGPSPVMVVDFRSGRRRSPNPTHCASHNPSGVTHSCKLNLGGTHALHQDATQFAGLGSTDERECHGHDAAGSVDQGERPYRRDQHDLVHQSRGARDRWIGRAADHRGGRHGKPKKGKHH